MNYLLSLIRRTNLTIGFSKPREATTAAARLTWIPYVLASIDRQAINVLSIVDNKNDIEAVTPKPDFYNAFFVPPTCNLNTLLDPLGTGNDRSPPPFNVVVYRHKVFTGWRVDLLDRGGYTDVVVLCPGRLNELEQLQTLSRFNNLASMLICMPADDQHLELMYVEPRIRLKASRFVPMNDTDIQQELRNLGYRA